MRVTIVHQAVDPDASEAEKDVLLQAESIAESLQRLGHTVQTTEVTLNLEQTRLDLVSTDPDRIFYLVESLDDTDSLAHLPAFLLETMQIPYTGAPAAALVLTNNKLRAKRVMALAGLPTPPWMECRQCADSSRRNSPELRFPATFIIKPIEEHASLGMTDDCVFEAFDERQLRERVQELSDLVDCSCFAEQFIEGREFNVAVLGTPDGPIVLPPAEIDFTSFPAGKPHIVGYNAKWVSGSFEYESTPRRFPCAFRRRRFQTGRTACRSRVPLLGRIRSPRLRPRRFPGRPRWRPVDSGNQRKPLSFSRRRLRRRPARSRSSPRSGHPIHPRRHLRKGVRTS